MRFKLTRQQIALATAGCVGAVIVPVGLAKANGGGEPPPERTSATSTTTPGATRPGKTDQTGGQLEGRVSVLERRADDFDGRLNLFESGDDKGGDRGEDDARSAPATTSPAPAATSSSSSPTTEPSGSATSSSSTAPAPAAPSSSSPTSSSPTATKTKPADRTADKPLPRLDEPTAPPTTTAKTERPAPPVTARTPTAPATTPGKTSATPDPLTGRVTKLEGQVEDLDGRLKAVEGGKKPTNPAPSVTSNSKPSPSSDPATGKADPPAAGKDPKTTDTGKDPKATKPADKVNPPVTQKPATTAKAGEVIFPKTGKPSDPGDKRVISPNKSPIVDPATLKGPKIVVKPGQPLGPVFAEPLAAGTVVELPRGEVYTEPVAITGQGTDAQPVLITAAAGAGELPTFTPAAVGNKDAGMVTTRGDQVQINELRVAGGEPKIGFDLGATKGVANRIEADGAVNAVWIRDGEQGGTGNGTRVWNSLFENGRMQVGMDKDDDDYGATAIAVQANNVTAEGITARNMISNPPGTPGDSPDYNKHGGDGALFEGWREVNDFHGSHSAVKVSPRVFEAGGLPGDGEAKVVISGIYADEITDAPFHVQAPGGQYAGLVTTVEEVDNNISVAKDKSKYGF